VEAKGGGENPTAAGGGAEQTGHEEAKPTCGHCGELGHFKMECYAWQKTPEGEKYTESDWGKLWLASRKKATVSRMEAQHKDEDANAGAPLHSLEDAMAALREEVWHTGPAAQMMTVLDHSAAFHKYCEDRKLDRVKLVRDQRAMALAGLKAKGKAAPEAPRGGRESLPRAARK
jgi:hypothetical protein